MRRVQSDRSLESRTLSKIGRVKLAPVDAEMRTSVSYMSQRGGSPYGPVTNAVKSSFLPEDCIFFAWLCNLREKPLCFRTTS